MDSVDAAKQAVKYFIDTFNDQDHEAHSKALNYPHVRLANGRFQRIDSAEQFKQNCINNEPRLREEGWHHTVAKSVEVVHASDDKVHLAITNDRCHEDGSVYKSFETFWIATLVEGHWAIQFRSSYLT